MTRVPIEEREPEKVREFLKLVNNATNPISIREAAKLTGLAFNTMSRYLKRIHQNQRSANIGTGPVPNPNGTRKSSGNQSSRQRTSRQYSNSSSSVSISTDDRPAPTGRRWAWEHYHAPSGKWLTREGEWWNPLARYTVGTTLPPNRWGAWEKGDPPEHYRFFYWTMEFLWNPKRYGSRTHPYGHIHKDMSIVLDDKEVHIVNIMVARGHNKSTHAGENFGTYTICEDWDTAAQGIMIITWAEKIAARTYGNIIDNLSENKKILDFYGYLIQDQKVSTRGKKKRFKDGECYFAYQKPGVGQAGLLVSTFMSGSITGFHPALAICDDIQDQAMSAAYKTQFEIVILEKLLPAADVGRVIFIGTYKGYTTDDDIYLYLQQNDLIEKIEYPAVLNAKTGEPDFPPWEDIDYEIQYIDRIDKRTGKPIYNRRGEVMQRKKFIIHDIKDRDRYEVTYPEAWTLDGLVHQRLKMRYDEDKGDIVFLREYQLIPVEPSGRLFKKDRLTYKPPIFPEVPGFVTFHDCAEWFRIFHEPVYAWVDPGGKKSHGISISIMGAAFRAYIVFNMKRIRKGVNAAVRWLLKMIPIYNITEIGVEGNFRQAETDANEMDKQLWDLCKRENCKEYYRPVTPINNTGDKIRRISMHVGVMLGHENNPPQYHVNPDSESIDDFLIEYRNFPEDEDKLGYDLLDTQASIKIHFFEAGPQDTGEEEDDDDFVAAGA